MIEIEFNAKSTDGSALHLTRYSNDGRWDFTHDLINILIVMVNFRKSFIVGHRGTRYLTR